MEGVSPEAILTQELMHNRDCGVTIPAGKRMEPGNHADGVLAMDSRS